MSTCGQCEYYLTKMDECPHQEKRALDKACDKLQYTNPRKRIDYLQAENKHLRELLSYSYNLPMNEAGAYDENIKWQKEVEQALKG